MAGNFVNGGAFPASTLPSQKQQALSTNYLNFTDGSGNDFAQQYLPEIYEAEIERYGNRTISGFLRMVGAEMPLQSDQVVWSEQNRLHVSYQDVGSDQATTLTLPSGHVIVPNMTLVVGDNTTVGGSPKTEKVIVGAVTDTTAIVYPYQAADLSGLGTTVNVFVYGSEFAKGTVGSTANITPSFTQFSNSPIIIKDKYSISGSDTAQIGWVEVATEAGTSGFLWYLKAEGETRLRFEDYLEMSVVEGELADAAGGFATNQQLVPGFSATINGKGTEGLFAAIEDRGNVYTNADFGGTGAGSGIAEFDVILKQLDTQGAIEENMLFLDRDTNLAFDDMLANISSGGNGGTAYGLFENSEEMALNLGFSGFRRGSYDFYKTDWKYLNDISTRGGMDDIDGVLIPAGTSTVYDQILGSNIRRPFLHVRYRASQADDRRMKSWITGSVGGAATSDLDAMEVHFLSERCLCVQAANNFVLFTSSPVV
jgi:hypothetical protein